MYSDRYRSPVGAGMSSQGGGKTVFHQWFPRKSGDKPVTAEMREPVQDLLEEEVRNEMPGVEPSKMSVEQTRRYALDPETYTGGDVEDAAKLMAILRRVVKLSWSRSRWRESGSWPGMKPLSWRSVSPPRATV